MQLKAFLYKQKKKIIIFLYNNNTYVKMNIIICYYEHTHSHTRHGVWAGAKYFLLPRGGITENNREALI